MAISKIYRRAHLEPHRMVWVRLSELDEEDDAILALIAEIEISSQYSAAGKARLQRNFIADGLRRMYGEDSLVEICRIRGLNRSNGLQFGETLNAREISLQQDEERSTAAAQADRPTREISDMPKKTTTDPRSTLMVPQLSERSDRPLSIMEDLMWDL